MDLDAVIHTSDLARVVAALIIGAIIGGEREYRGKAAGFRTMTLICLGSAIFTILSLRLGAHTSPDRIASNIVTGIGFLGAGVIFRDSVGISGLTTATSIWATAALGMAAGAGELGLATIGLILALIVLGLFDRLQDLIERLHQKRSYRFQFSSTRLTLPELEKILARFRVGFRLRKVAREAQAMTCWYDVWGSSAHLQELSDFFVNAEHIVLVEYSV